MDHRDAVTMYEKVLDTGDWRDGGAHEMEVSHFLWGEMRWDQYFFTQYFQQDAYDVHSRPRIRFVGMFTVKVIHKPLALGAATVGAEQVDRVDNWGHLALRVERQNGRFAYFEHAENDECMK